MLPPHKGKPKKFRNRMRDKRNYNYKRIAFEFKRRRSKTSYNYGTTMMIMSSEQNMKGRKNMFPEMSFCHLFIL